MIPRELPSNHPVVLIKLTGEEEHRVFSAHSNRNRNRNHNHNHNHLIIHYYLIYIRAFF
jgi:hypothetical protein